ncbi:hypothetical protein TVAG_453620 [Trichomonas vaginalis G3]|uniref:Nucleotide-diphospho-sugar transferase domain-containing protein n=1 Tax=Trichomonas vaginalis (strain ATCC PRA-98 / G3) TaxID=412133 RepID=A2DPT8_TRIV3|nr:UDP-D-xylose:L-fucose alpha-1,3-D-xylosyltransferase-related family [Trichomonas vaginalis G3]EAY17534.1 hypothetical protein TVAG_453620 [Trichomonas vaginalis G3]KAI5520578.1 UDP-D-xylose:L-fucose alpha-1,3-D-xylosyltransferase-related family [Trichomonas vaginalis G3]|eukprot:XP_001329669.1 hypothetical protein [Trichomonas vaginalis G3]
MEEPRFNIGLQILMILSIFSSFSALIYCRSRDSVVLGCFNYDRPISESKFKDELHLMIMKSTVNDNTNRRDIVLFVTNAGMIKLTRNALCSLWMTNVPKERIIVVATDKISYLNMQKFGANTVYYPTNQAINSIDPSDTNEFVDFIRVKFKIAKFVIHNTTDLSLADSDIIFFANPLVAFSFDTDIEASIDSPNDPVIPKKSYLSWGINLNFAHYRSTSVMKKFMNVWEDRIDQLEYTESQALLDIINNLPTERSFTDTLTINLEQYFEPDPHNPFQIRYVNPVFGVEARGPLMGSSTLKRVFWKEARKHNMSRPLWCHFGGLGTAQQKISKMKDYKLWYLDESDHCLPNPPKGGRKYFW